MEMEYFEIFDLPPLLKIDLQALEKKFHELSRKHHPDYHTGGSTEDRERSLRITSLVNDAYRTLRNPTRRAEYLVRSQGLKVDGSQVPPALLAEVFEINEELEEIRSARSEGSPDPSLLEELDRFRAGIAEKRRGYDQALEEAGAEWDRLIADGEGDAEARGRQLAKLADILAESSYLRNLEQEIANEVSE